MKIKVVIEIPKGSNVKYEFNRKTNMLEVDRILREDFLYPCNYGFVPSTLDWDGDELDVLVYSPEKFLPNSALNVRVIGAMKMVDDGETDTKLVAVHADDFRLEHIKELKDLPFSFLVNLEAFFANYKNFKRVGITKVEGFESKEWALDELKECYELFEKYSSLPKNDFIKKMKEKHPEKYS